MNKKFSTSNTCGVPTNASCVSYNPEVPESSELFEEGCLNIEQTTEDLYKRTEDINTQIDLSELGQDCLTYVEDPENRIIVKNVLLKYEEEICALKQSLEDISTGASICDSSIEGCNLSYNGLINECGEEPQNLGELLQIIINQITAT